MERVHRIHEQADLPAHAATIAAASDLFHGVGMEVLQPLFERCPILDLAAGESLFLPEPGGECLYLVLEGRLRARPEPDALPGCAKLLAGAWIGEMTVIDGFDTAAEVTAETDARLLRMDARCLWSLIARSHEAARNLFAILSRRMAGAPRAPNPMHGPQPVPPTVRESMRRVG